MITVMAIDPGTCKCGIAVVDDNCILHKEIAETDSITSTVGQILSRFPIDIMLIGGGTGSQHVFDLLRDHIEQVPLEVAEESFTTLDARQRFFRDNPPKGLLRLMPRGLLVPHRPIDDYAAVLLAERFINRLHSKEI